MVESFGDWTQQFLTSHRVLIQFIRSHHAQTPEFFNMNDYEIYKILGDEVERLNPGKFLKSFFDLN